MLECRAYEVRGRYVYDTYGTDGSYNLYDFRRPACLSIGDCDFDLAGRGNSSIFQPERNKGEMIIEACLVLVQMIDVVSDRRKMHRA